jgi:hypothetical protein
LQITKTHQSSTSDLCGNDGTYKDAKSIDKDNKEESKRNKKRVLWTFHPLIHLTQSGEAVLKNVFLKWLQLHQKSRSTRSRSHFGWSRSPPKQALNSYLKFCRTR